MSTVEIINVALARLGESPIQSLDEGTVPANVAKIFYDQERRATLRDYNWNFALKTARLAKLAETPVDFRFAYALPSDCIRAIRLRSGGVPDYAGPGLRFVVRGGMVLSDEDPALLEYVSNCTDTTQFDDKFIEALSYKLASAMAMSIKGSTELTQSFLREYTAIVSQAAALSGNENRDADNENPYVEARG
jgi:hypothetical protein